MEPLPGRPVFTSHYFTSATYFRTVPYLLSKEPFGSPFDFPVELRQTTMAASSTSRRYEHEHEHEHEYE